MKKLENQTNAPVGDADYPNSRIKDESGPGVGNGVHVNESVWGDSMQFFQKLLIDAGIVANDLFDNVTNGYQTISALVDKIEKTILPPVWININVPGSHDVLYRETKLNTVQMNLSLLGFGVLAGVTIFTLPAGYRPIREYNISLSYNSSITILTTGVVKAGTNGANAEAGTNYLFFEFPLD